MSGLSFGLNVKKGASKAPAVKAKPRFVDDDSDADGGSAPNDNGVEITKFDEEPMVSKLSTRPAKGIASRTETPSRPPKSKAAIPQGGDLSTLRSQKKYTSEAEALDPSVFDYDAHFDAVHAKQAAKKAAEKADAEQGKPKYMENLLAAAETRKRDQLRAKDKLLQREREQEGDEYADKDKFVTTAYKEQQEEVRKMEEEEAQREKEEARKKKAQGMSGFFRSIMDEEEKRHQEAVEAAAQMKPGDTAPAVEGPKERSDMERARELNEQGGNIVINEEGEIADKRQLLSAGLNVSIKPKAAAGTAESSRTSRVQQPSALRGRNETQKAQRERQSRMIEEQLEAAQKRAAEEEASELQKREQAAKSQKTAGDISDARARYLARKKAAAAGE